MLAKRFRYGNVFLNKMNSPKKTVTRLNKIADLDDFLVNRPWKPFFKKWIWFRHLHVIIPRWQRKERWRCFPSPVTVVWNTRVSFSFCLVTMLGVSTRKTSCVQRLDTEKTQVGPERMQTHQHEPHRISVTINEHNASPAPHRLLNTWTEDAVQFTPILIDNSFHRFSVRCSRGSSGGNADLESGLTYRLGCQKFGGNQVPIS